MINEVNLVSEVYLHDIRSDAMAAVKSHMERQPWDCTCKCGVPLKCDSTLDDDLDLHLVVYPCTCQTEEKSDE